MTSTPKAGMRKAIAGFALAGALAIPAIAFAAPSSAERNQDAYENNPGVLHFQEGGAGAGAQNSPEGSYVPGSGAFGSLTGQGYNWAGGRQGDEIGLNNSSVASNHNRTDVTQPTPRRHPAPQNGG